MESAELFYVPGMDCEEHSVREKEYRDLMLHGVVKYGMHKPQETMKGFSGDRHSIRARHDVDGNKAKPLMGRGYRVGEAVLRQHARRDLRLISLCTRPLGGRS